MFIIAYFVFPDLNRLVQSDRSKNNSQENSFASAGSDSHREPGPSTRTDNFERQNGAVAGLSSKHHLVSVMIVNRQKQSVGCDALVYIIIIVIIIVVTLLLPR
jgi:hypothetical protein